VLEGAVDKMGKAVIEAAKTAFPDLSDLTIESLVLAEPMVYMNVQITEFNTSALENLGINWSTTFNGPSMGWAHDWVKSGAPEQAGVKQEGNPLVAAVAGGYFGIATLITSKINVAVSNGDALLIASPTLSARSGGKAEFLSGGEIPYPVPGPNATVTIEFKEFGIKLNVEPRAGIGGNVVAKVFTEVSSIDESVTVEGVPGLKTRKTSTEASLRDGETLVISGLVNNEVGKDINKVKWLGDLPILGPLFRSTNFRNKRSDLVIFITPHIIDAESPENKAAIAHAKKLREDFFRTVGESEEILD